MPLQLLALNRWKREFHHFCSTFSILEIEYQICFLQNCLLQIGKKATVGSIISLNRWKREFHHFWFLLFTFSILEIEYQNCFLQTCFLQIGRKQTWALLFPLNNTSKYWIPPSVKQISLAELYCYKRVESSGYTSINTVCTLVLSYS